MQQYKKVELYGENYLLAFVDFLPTPIEDARKAVLAVGELENIKSSKSPAAQSIITDGLVSAMYSNGTIYISKDLQDNKAELEDICARVAEAMFTTEFYYQPEELVQGFNPHPDEDGTDIHSHVLRTGFATKANIYNNGQLLSFTTMGLHHQGLPELVVFGSFGGCVDMIMGIIHRVADYMKEHGFKDGIYPKGSIFDEGKIAIKLLDKEHVDMEDVLLPIEEYWQKVDYQAAQIIIADHAMRLPDEMGYSQHTNHQPVLPQLKEISYA